MQDKALCEAEEVSLGALFKLWYPLALSRLIMNADGLIVAGFLARLANPTLSLASFGGVVFPLMFLLECPVWMLLTASTALSDTEERFYRLLKYSRYLVASLLVVEFLLVFTPLYDFVLVTLLHASEPIVSYSWWGFIVSTPWIPLVADRRIRQGVLIRAGKSHAIAKGTLIRLVTLFGSLLLGASLPYSALVVSCSAITFSLFCEWFYIWQVFAAEPCFSPRQSFSVAQGEQSELTFKYFLRYYLPLALTSLVGIIRRPLGSAALFRMPLPLESAAAAPAWRGVVDLLFALSLSFVEVVVFGLKEPNARTSLWKFCLILSGTVILVLSAVVLTPLSDFVLITLLHLPPELTELVRLSLLLSIPVPALGVLQAFYQGEILVSGRTRLITEAMMITVVVLVLGLLFGIAAENFPGLYLLSVANCLSVLAQTLWLRFRGYCHK
jgi:hypothetical protein